MRLLIFLLTVFVGLTAVAGARADTAASDDKPADPAPLADALLEHALEPWTGDLTGILDRGFIRVATANSPLLFSADGLQETGLAVAFAHEMEKYLDKTHPKKGRRMSVVLMPMARDQILPALVAGRADVAFANLTVTPERAELVDFLIPSRKNVRELIVTGPGAPEVKTIDDLARTVLHVRESSSYHQHLQALNASREADGNPTLPIQIVDEFLEDYDILEMIEAGIVPATVVDDHKLEIWSETFDGLTVHDELAINDGGEIAGAIRRGSPDLKDTLNKFVKTIRKGSLTGNILIKRFLSPKYVVENVRGAEAESRYAAVIDIIETYAAQYEFDTLMIAAQGFQESRLDQSKRSHVGAVGIMQVMPTTARDPVVGIPDIEDAEANVHAGVRYLRYLHDTYFDKPEIEPLDRVLLSFAAYNAGPGGIGKARRRAEKMGLDPNVWFDNVEVAAARTISREPVVYVRNIYKYYVAYRLITEANENGAGTGQ